MMRALLRRCRSGAGAVALAALVASGPGVAAAEADPRVTVVPAATDFGGWTVGTPSVARTFILGNAAGEQAELSSIELRGVNERDFSIDSDDCTRTHGGVLDGQESCIVLVTFRPEATGTRTATLSIAATGAFPNPTSALTGLGVAPSSGSAVSMARDAVNFGGLLPFTTSAPATFTVANTGAAPATLTSIGTSGGDVADFIVDATDCTTLPAGRLDPGETCRVTASFSPLDAVDEFSSTLAVVSGDGGTPTAALFGWSVPAGAPVGAPTVAPLEQEFGSQRVGTSRSAMTFTVRNGGISGFGANGPVEIVSIETVGADRDDFLVDDSDCMDPGAHGGILEPIDTCIVEVAFEPSRALPRTATLAVTTGSGKPTSWLTGTGEPGSGGSDTLTLSPTSGDFGEVEVGASSRAQTFTVRNTGDDVATISDIGMDGSQDADFIVDPDDCTRIHAGSLGPADSCDVSVTFAPREDRERSSTLRVLSDRGNPTSALSGAGLGPQMLVTPEGADFGGVVLGSPGPWYQFRLRNIGNAEASIYSIGNFGNPFDFLIDYSNCMVTHSARLAPGASCTIGEQFTPTVAATRESGLAVQLLVGSRVRAAPGTQLTGTGEPTTDAAAVTITPAQRDFGHERVRTGSGVGAFSIINSGSEAATITSIRLIDGVMSDFFVGTSNCIGTLPPGRTCTFDSSFTPHATGQRGARVQVDAGDGGTPTAYLEGTGTID